MGGYISREGRVEVCVDGHWETVCNNSQEGIAGAVCSQLGFPAKGDMYCYYLKECLDVEHFVFRSSFYQQF